MLSEVFIDHIPSKKNENNKAKKPVKRGVSTDSTDLKHITLLHFPQRPVSLNRDVEFVIQKHGAHGLLEVKVLTPSGKVVNIELRNIDADRLAVRFGFEELGCHYIQVKLNGKHITNSPFPIEVVEKRENSQTELFSYASLVKPIGMPLKRIKLQKWNEFRVDATCAGDFMLLVGIYGPNGHAEELFVRHLGLNLYVVSFYPLHFGPYLISIKWGDEDVPGSPYYVTAIDW